MSEFKVLVAEHHKILPDNIEVVITNKGDEGLIRRLTDMLFANAVKYCDAGGQIQAYV